jgi:hypothetical protein
LAALLFVASIVGADIVIETNDRIAYTDTGLAVISLGAWVTIEAFALIQGLMATASLPATEIGRTWVAIVAGAVVDQAVAVVVDAVACFCGRGRRGTGW